MSDYLVAVEIKVDPAVGFSAGFATEDIAVETPGGFQIGNWEC
jgi:hypothetical protein